MTRVVIHLGAGKCGSSAIQQYLKQQRDNLLAAGVLVPDKDCSWDGKVIGEQIWFFEQLRELPDAAAQERWQQRCADLLKRAADSNVHTIIFSAENLINPTNIAPQLAGLLDQCEVQLCLYVRRQLDYLVSAWQQWYLKVYPDPAAFLAENTGQIANWNGCLAPWESAFGSQRISLRVYDRSMLEAGGVVEDFLTTLGLEDCPPVSAALDVNRSYCDAMTGLAMRARDQFSSMHDNNFYLAMQQLVGDRAWRREITAYPFSASQVEAIEAAYGPDNEDLRRKYLPQQEGPLFASAASAGILPLDADAERQQVLELLNFALSRLGSQENFDYAPAAEFAALLESLRSSC
jgi:hypothetical protein